jgi:hypothetical protein
VATYPRQGRRTEATHPGGVAQPRLERDPLSLGALDAVISASIGKPVRRDRLARDDRVYRWAVRRAKKEGGCFFRTTYAEAARGAGYDVPRLTGRANCKRAREQRVSTIYRALRSLELAGLLRFQGVKRENGQWRCLSVSLTDAAFGPCPPCGRSPRRPRRGPGGRISFSGKSGTSPSVPPSAVTADKRVPVRARGREGSAVPTQARRTRGDPERREAPGASWPLERFDVAHESAVVLCEEFEAAFGRPANFSFRRHGERLARILARFDRFSGLCGKDGAGLEEARAIVRAVGEESRCRTRGVEAGIASLAYFLPILDEASKGRRRWWKNWARPRFESL